MDLRGSVEDIAPDWTVDQLIDFILSTDHVRIRAVVPEIERRFLHLLKTKGGGHPALVAAAAALNRLAVELDRHLAKEERVLFPYLRELAATSATGECAVCPFGTVEHPIRMLEREHLETLTGLRHIRDLTDGAQRGTTAAAAATCSAELRRFEIDLSRHFLLEDQVLFPKALALEAGTQPSGRA